MWKNSMVACRWGFGGWGGVLVPVTREKVLSGFCFVSFFIDLACAYNTGFISALLNSAHLTTSNIRWEKKASGNLSK